MNKRCCDCIVLLSICLLLALCGCDGSVPPAASAPAAPVLETSAPETVTPGAAPVPELSQREADWLEDFTFLKQQYIQYHPDPFYFCTEEEFDWKLDRLAAKIPQLTDNDIYFELSTIMAGMGDTHTEILPSDSFYDRAFPAVAYFFGDRLYLCGCLEGYEELAPFLLREIVAVNGVDMGYLKQQFERFIDPSNSWRAKELFQRNYFFPAFFDWVGGDKEGYVFQILNDNREVEFVEMPVISYSDYVAACRSGEVVYPESLRSIPYLSSGNRVEYFQEDTGECVYLFFSEMRSVSDTLLQEMIREPFEQAAELIEAHPSCDKLVIDLRGHFGGNLTAFECVRQCAQMLKATSIKRTYIVTGGYTQSAAIECIAILKDELDAVIVGEPTGQFTSFFMYDYLPAVVLPHSRIKVVISTGWWDGAPLTEIERDENGRLYEWESTILPDVFVYQDIEDIRQGKDSVIEWVLAQ